MFQNTSQVFFLLLQKFILSSSLNILKLSCILLVFRFNLLFLLSGGGKFNFQGTKKWIEDNIDGSGLEFFIGNKCFHDIFFCNPSLHVSAENSLLQEVQFAVCLDSLGIGNELNIHVSKPPRPGSVSYVFHKVRIHICPLQLITYNCYFLN